LIDQAMVVGDGRSYLVALVVPSAAARSPAASGGNTKTLLADCIARRLACVSHHEQVRRFAILDQPFSIETGELTPTLKLRRNIIARNYAQEIAALYAATAERQPCAPGV
jgi:long-chain acyl-CoA synthetase